MLDEIRLAMFISGGGSTMDAILDACQTRILEGVRPVLIVSSSPSAGGILKAQARHIKNLDIRTINPKRHGSMEAFANALHSACARRRVNLIGQYGWMPHTPAPVIREYEGRMINQHPGPLDPGRPDFGGRGMFGRRVHCVRLLYVRHQKELRPWTEMTAQLVSSEYDQGALLQTRRVPIRPDDTVETLQQRCLPVEHALQISVLRSFAEGTAQPLPPRETPLIGADALDGLNLYKWTARNLYPNG